MKSLKVPTKAKMKSLKVPTLEQSIIINNKNLLKAAKGARRRSQ